MIGTVRSPRSRGGDALPRVRPAADRPAGRVSVPAHDSRGEPRAHAVPRSDVLGLVLCGGRSERMGRDKALLVHDGRPLLDHAIAAVGHVADDLRLATGPEPRYAERGYEAVLDHPDHRGLGPVAGLCAGLAAARAVGRPWLATLACDMPGATGEPLARLLERAATKNLDACLFEHGGHLEPLLAVYHVRALGPLRRALGAGRARMIDFHEGFGTLRVDRWSSGTAGRAGGDAGPLRGAPGGATVSSVDALARPTQPGEWVRNVNTPEDWRALADGRAPERRG